MAKRKRLSPLGALPDGALSDAPIGKVPDHALRRRVPIASIADDAARTAALEDVTDTLSKARAEGRMIMPLPLDDIHVDHIIRDRIAVDDDDMEALKQSLRARGQQTPIDVVELEPGRFGLLSGWRRCMALQALHAETGDDRFRTVLALVRPIVDAPEAYVAMIEENEIRVGLSYFERARVVAETVDQGVFETDRAALRTLFASASRAKRSKIGSFVGVVRALGTTLRFPQALGERAGLKLAKALDAQSGLDAVIAADWGKHPPVDAAEEQTRLLALCRGRADNAVSAKAPSRAAPPALPNGVEVTTVGKGRLTLLGHGIDAEFTDALRAWLAEKGF